MKAIVCLIAGWLIPGLGHVLQKKYWRGAIFFISIIAMTAIGLSMGGRIYPFQTENPLTILAFFADIGNSVVYALSQLLAFGQGSLERITFEFGTAYIAGAGLLNYLIAIDAHDIAKGKKK
jgi:predicted membrane channel-forming protein YqfA (hemolysin III family)